MQTFPVWLQAVGSRHQITVERISDAHWLLSRLSRDFVFKNSTPLRTDHLTGHCSFEIASLPPTSFSGIQTILKRIPTVFVVNGSACDSQESICSDSLVKSS